MTIFETLVKRIQAAGDVDLSAEIEPCMFGEDEITQDVLPLEDDEIPMKDAVQKCHEIAERMRMYE